MNKVNQYIALHIGYTEAREKGLNKVAAGFDLDMKQIHETLTNEQKDEVWKEINKLYPKVKQ